MQRLLIHFANADLSEFRWTRHDETSDAPLVWQYAGAGDLAEAAKQNPLPAILIVPQQCVYLTRVELPEKAGRQVLSAIEYQVEDQLAQDIESQHFALGDPSENPIAIAVVEREIMDTCRALAQGFGLRVQRIVPELFLCPWSADDGIVLTEGYDGCLLRYGAYRGLKCNAQALPAMLELVRRETDVERIVFYAGDDEPSPELDGYTLERRPASAAILGLFNAPLIDLQQRDFQPASQWIKLARAWKWVGILVAVLALAFGFNRAIALQQLEAELAEVHALQYALLKPHLPASTRPDDNLKRLLIQRLEQLQASEREQGFLKLLLDFSRARASQPGVEISRIGYQGQRLNVDLSSQQLASIEALQQALVKAGVAARLENLNIKPELISGRLVLEGGDDA